jgi:flagellin-like protein
VRRNIFPRVVEYGEQIMTGRTNDQAVSVIVGTLMLILITVTAAAGLAVMISTMQKDEMNRQTHIAAVKNENITILNVAFENNQTEWVDVPNPKNWSSVRVTLLNMNIDDVTVMGIAINGQYALNFTDKS